MSLNTWTGLISAAVGVVGLVLQYWEPGSRFFKEYIMQRTVVDLWFLWSGLAVFGVCRFIRSQRELRGRVITFETMLVKEKEGRMLQNTAFAESLQCYGSEIDALKAQKEYSSSLVHGPIGEKLSGAALLGYSAEVR